MVFVVEGFSYDFCLADTSALNISESLVAGQWALHMTRHPNRYFVATITNIIKGGAKIGYIGPSRFSIFKNHSSANEAPEILIADVNRQLAAGRLIALSFPLPKDYICSPLGLVPKSSGG